MNRIPFTIYDFFAYLSSGSVLVVTIDYLFGFQWVIKKDMGPVLALLLIFLSYIAGHCVAHFSSPILEQLFVGTILKRPSLSLMGEKPKPFLAFLFPGYYKPLPIATQDRVWEQANARGFSGSGEALFIHAYAVVTKNEHAQKRLDEFRNLYGFSRNMAFVFLASAVLIFLSTFSSENPASIWWALISCGLGVTMLYRYLKFFRQFSYQLFITYAELDKPQTKEDN